ncbi:hypothetical protein C0V77_15840 [Emticicia sp. TH156]|nr:hypothetical protein C0V77_15840 [Emticicia sp. TH156]
MLICSASGFNVLYFHVIRSVFFSTKNINLPIKSKITYWNNTNFTKLCLTYIPFYHLNPFSFQ